MLSVLFFIACLAFLIGGCNQKAKRAKTYHEQVLSTVRVVIDSSLDFGDAVQSYNKTKAVQGFEQYSGLVNTNISKVQNMGAFDGDTILPHYALEMLNFYKNTLQNGFKPFFQSVRADSFTTEQKAVADSFNSNFSMNEAQYWNRFNWAEGQFDKKFGLVKTEEKQ